RNWAVARAEVQMASSGTSMPLDARRARRSLGGNIELFVSTWNRRAVSTRAWMNSGAPGMAWSSWTRTPSMSVSQHSRGGRGVVLGVAAELGWALGGGLEVMAPIVAPVCWAQ